jgi:hypothetical protein
MAVFSQTEVEAIADAPGDTNLGLTGNEIAHLLQTLRIADPDPTYSKRHRLLNALAADQNKRQNRKGILEFICRAMAAARWLGKRDCLLNGRGPTITSFGRPPDLQLFAGLYLTATILQNRRNLTFNCSVTRGLGAVPCHRARVGIRRLCWKCNPDPSSSAAGGAVLQLLPQAFDIAG